MLCSQFFERYQHTAGQLFYTDKRQPFSPHIILEISFCFLYTELMATFSQIPLNQLLQQKLRNFWFVFVYVCSGMAESISRQKVMRAFCTSWVGKLGRHFVAIVPVLLTRKCVYIYCIYLYIYVYMCAYI